jgi:hypothetical protein
VPCFLHSLLSIIMALKLLPEVLDKFDIFVLEIEELLIPKVNRPLMSRQGCINLL